MSATNIRADVTSLDENIAGAVSEGITPDFSSGWWQSLQTASSLLLSQTNWETYCDWVAEECIAKLNCSQIQIIEQQPDQTTKILVDKSSVQTIPSGLKSSDVKTIQIDLIQKEQIRGNLIAHFSPETVITAAVEGYLQQMSVQLMLSKQQSDLIKHHQKITSGHVAIQELFDILHHQSKDRLVQSQQYEVQNTRLEGHVNDLTQLTEQLEYQNLRAHLLASLGHKIRQSIEYSEILATAVDEVRTCLNADRVIAYQIDPQGAGEITHESCKGAWSSTLGFKFPAETFPLDCQSRLASLPYKAISHAGESYQDHPCMLEFIEQWDIKSKVIVPIAPDGLAWGFLIVHHCAQYHDWSEDELSLLSEIRDQLENALLKAKLYQDLKKELTIKKEIEAKLQQSLTEKNGLIKDTHHRVKNNLNLVSSILNLQSNYYDDEKISDILVNSRLRIYSIAAIHENLYASEDYKSLQLRAYIEDLINQIRASHQSDTRHISVNLEVEACHFNVDTALPIGLIINELITNCFKFAFPESIAGEVSIKFSQNQEKYTLTIQDNGVGIPETIDWEESPSLGLKLVRLLGQQLDSEVKRIATDIGTAFELTFAEVESIVSP